MAKYVVTTLSFIGNKLVEAGTVVDIDTKVMKPGSNLEPVKATKAGAVDAPSSTEPADEAPV